MAKYGIQTLVKSFHDELLTIILDDGESSETFQVTHGVKLGCELAPTLFSMVFSAMLKRYFMTTQTPWPSSTALMTSCLI